MDELKGYRVRVTVDYPLWGYNEEYVRNAAHQIAHKSYSATRIMNIEIVKTGKPDNVWLMDDSEFKENHEK